MSLNKKTYSSGDVITSNNLNEIQDAIIVNENNISTINTNINSLNTKVDSIQNSATLQTITISASKWAPDPVSGFIAQIIPCNGVTSNNNIIVSPNPTILNVKAYRDNNIICVSQTLNSLDFWAETCPTSNIKIDVLIMGGN